MVGVAVTRPVVGRWVMLVVVLMVVAVRLRPVVVAGMVVGGFTTLAAVSKGAPWRFVPDTAITARR